MRADAIIMVDWSAAATPKTGGDSVWWALHRPGADAVEQIENPSTRAEAIETLIAVAAAEASAGRRVLIGFDFPFGYPRGASERMLDAFERPPSSEPVWARLWATLAAEIADGPKNANNRFAVAETINATSFDGAGPFWGRPPKPFRQSLPEKKPIGYGARYPAERRLVEQRIRSTQPVWKLFTTGSVGGQTLMGIAALERLRRDPRLEGLIEIWPFETGLRDADSLTTPVVVAEIYPSLLPPDPRFDVKDAGQVAAMSRRLAELAAEHRLGPLFDAPPDLSDADRKTVEREEAWILGAGREDLLRGGG